MTQVNRILEHLKNHGSITQAEAINLFGCYRLSGRIYDIKQLGYDIGKKMECSENRYGEATCYARYFFKGGC